jgi:hypothetical protein
MPGNHFSDFGRSQAILPYGRGSDAYVTYLRSPDRKGL